MMSETEQRPATVLVVDDREEHRELIVASLEGRGYRMLEAADAASALEVARRERPQLVFLDLQLRGSDIDGVGLARLLKREQPGMRVVAYSAWAIPEWRERARQAGCDAYLTKPVELAQVRRVAARYLESDTPPLSEEGPQPGGPADEQGDPEAAEP